MMRSSVVLPQPDGPTKHTISPGVIVRSIDCSATNVPNALCTLSILQRVDGGIRGHGSSGQVERSREQRR